jgi:hypothetical protein
MSEFLGARKYSAAVLVAGIGGSMLTGCASTSAQTWEIGVVCPQGSKAEVESLDTDPYFAGDNDARIDVMCANKQGINKGVTGMELTKGQGAIIDSSKDYTNTVQIKYEDQRDGYTPEISMDALTGFIVTDNVKIESVAVTD